MRTASRDQYATPQQTYYYVQGLLRVDDEDYETNYEQAVGVCYNYLIQKKIQWGIYLQKLMELFLDLAFETQKHSKIKQVLKNYRSVTQNQHPDSLKSILEYYRDNKLQQILDQQIPKDGLTSIREMKSIEDDQASSEIIISSFTPEIKYKKEQIKTNLKTVWEGYKAIIDTVRFNHKLEGVYRTTLKKIFQFVDVYNRKQEFKNFCEYSRSGLRNVMNKRGDKTEQQKGFYIDIEKQQVNTNNIQIRLQQFNLTTKLGLWQQAFQILEDINEIMKVRKGPLKNSIKCAYFENLATIFKKSNYWHYHAYAFYNYYSIYITKTKLAAADRIKAADKLILSILCIPPSTIESNQSKESQQKIASMMISGSKIPKKQQLQQMMISRGVVESSSPEIKQLWYFMFLDFDLTSLSKGLRLLDKISKEGQYKQFIQLLEDILIYKQLISVAEVYQRIKYSSLLSIIPLPKQKIQKVLLECHHRKVIDFVFDERQGIIIFEDQMEETNPYEEFLSCFVDVALLHEESRKHDKGYIIKKAIDFMNTADDYYNNIRTYKIDQYKKKLKKPRQQLDEKVREEEKKRQQQKRHQQLLKRQKEAEEKAQNQQKMKLFIEKKVRINEIITVKQNRIVKIGNRRIQNLTDDEIKQMDKQIFEQGLKQITARVANENQNRNKKRFLKIDYLERQRRFELTDIIAKTLADAQKAKLNSQKIEQIAKTDHEQKLKLKQEIQKVAPEVKNKIDENYRINKEKYEKDMQQFKQNITEQFKKKVLKRARQLLEAAQKKKKQDQEKRRSQQVQKSQDNWSFKPVVRTTDASGKTIVVSKQGQASQGGAWRRKQKTTDTTTTVEEGSIKKQFPKKDNKGGDSWVRKGPTTGITNTNAFADLKVDDDDKKQSKKWNMGSKQQAVEVNNEKKVQQKQQGGWIARKKDAESTAPKEEPKKFVPPPVQQSKGAWGKGKATVDVNADTKKPNGSEETKKQQKKPKGKGW